MKRDTRIAEIVDLFKKSYPMGWMDSYDWAASDEDSLATVKANLKTFEEETFYLFAQSVLRGEYIIRANYQESLEPLAVFNVKNEKVTENIDFSAIPALGDGEYVAYEYFTKKYLRIKKNDSLPFDLEAKGIAAFSIYPVKADENGDEYVMMGSTEKYIPIASKNKIKVSLGDIEF